MDFDTYVDDVVALTITCIKTMCPTKKVALKLCRENREEFDNSIADYFFDAGGALDHMNSDDIGRDINDLLNDRHIQKMLHDVDVDINQLRTVHPYMADMSLSAIVLVGLDDLEEIIEKLY